jgi:hypothetical protein
MRQAFSPDVNNVYHFVDKDFNHLVLLLWDFLGFFKFNKDVKAFFKFNKLLE